MQMKTTLRFHLSVVRMTKTTKQLTSAVIGAGANTRKGEPSQRCGDCRPGQLLYNGMENPQKSMHKS